MNLSHEHFPEKTNSVMVWSYMRCEIQGNYFEILNRSEKVENVVYNSGVKHKARWPESTRRRLQFSPLGIFRICVWTFKCIKGPKWNKWIKWAIFCKLTKTFSFIINDMNSNKLIPELFPWIYALISYNLTPKSCPDRFLSLTTAAFLM